MKFLELATERFSVREFSSRPVEEEKVSLSGIFFQAISLEIIFYPIRIKQGTQI